MICKSGLQEHPGVCQGLQPGSHSSGNECLGPESLLFRCLGNHVSPPALSPGSSVSSARAHAVVLSSDYSPMQRLLIFSVLRARLLKHRTDLVRSPSALSRGFPRPHRGLQGTSWPDPRLLASPPCPSPLAGSIPAPAVCQAGTPGPLHWPCQGLPSHPLTRELFALPFSPLTFPLPSSSPLPFSFFPRF